MTTKNNKVKVYGPLVNDLQIYLENRQMEESSLYSAIDFEETERNYGTGKLAGVVEVRHCHAFMFAGGRSCGPCVTRRRVDPFGAREV